MEGNKDVFYGLLDDIWHCFHNKTSPLDIRYAPPKNSNSSTRFADKPEVFNTETSDNAFKIE